MESVMAYELLCQLGSKHAEDSEWSAGLKQVYEDCFVYQAARAQFTPPLSPCKAEVEPQPRGDLLKRRRYEESIRGAPKRGSSGCNVVGIVKRYSRDELRAILKANDISYHLPGSKHRNNMLSKEEMAQRYVDHVCASSSSSSSSSSSHAATSAARNKHGASTPREVGGGNKSKGPKKRSYGSMHSFHADGPAHGASGRPTSRATAGGASSPGTPAPVLSTLLRFNASLLKARAKGPGR